MSNTSAKQALAHHQAELSERRSLAAVNTQRRADLQAAISRMTAEQEIDGVDHSKRLVKARADLGLTEEWLRTWPAVESELVRRVGEAQAATTLEWRDEQIDRLAGCMAAEKALRLAYAVRNWEFQNLCFELRKVLRLKDQFLNDCFEQGLPLRQHAGTTEMPNGTRFAGTEQSVAAARELYREWTGEDPEKKVAV